jgi:hypothetical protein
MPIAQDLETKHAHEQAQEKNGVLNNRMYTRLNNLSP